MAKEEKYTYAIGRRKTASATVRLFESKGKNKVNEEEFGNYFSTPTFLSKAQEPFKAIGKNFDDFYFTAKVQGGGLNAQVEAIQLGLSRALVELFPDSRKDLKDGAYLTRDPRMVERKKTGLRKARKREQFSKR